MPEILDLLKLKPSPQSVDYVENRRQFHLFNLSTEQRHPATANLGLVSRSNMEAGLKMLLSVDRDISRRLAQLAGNPAVLEQAVQAVHEAIRAGRKIYIYGCGATGRLAKQMESTFWRPFWRRVRRHPAWERLQTRLPADIEERLIGEMTGADRALVSSLEGFEDLQLIGRLQLEDRQVAPEDVVFCLTEGGETSSVIGTILGAFEQRSPSNPARRDEAPGRLYFVYNNPDHELHPYERCASVFDNPAIARINLTTGPQALAGSTRMQATTIGTFVVGAILEEAIARILREHLSPLELRELGYGQDLDLAARLASFDNVKNAVDAAIPSLAQFAELETETYRHGRFTTYFANGALLTVFIDSTERSPTFRLYPLDRGQDPQRRSWVQVWTEAGGCREAWRKFLGRPFRGLEFAFYRKAFEQQVQDPYLKEAALHSLGNAGSDQETAYDFSFSDANVERNGPGAGDLGVAVLIDNELDTLAQANSPFRRFLALFHHAGAKAALVSVAGPDSAGAATSLMQKGDARVHLALDTEQDPLTLRRQVALKMLLNAHSTVVMAALGRVIGNTMTNVSPSNLKLIGRATFLIMMHVSDTLAGETREGAQDPGMRISFAEANAVLFDAMDYVRSRAAGQTSEVALSIIRIVEALRRRAAVPWEEAQAILEGRGLSSYLSGNTPNRRTGRQ